MIVAVLELCALNMFKNIVTSLLSVSYSDASLSVLYLSDWLRFYTPLSLKNTCYSDAASSLLYSLANLSRPRSQQSFSS